MKNLVIISLLFFVSRSIFSQKVVLDQGGGAYEMPVNSADCVSEQQRQLIFAEINKNREVLKDNNFIKKSRNPSMVHPLFIWPVVKNPSSPFANVWSISNYVDHNQSFPNQVQDWNCGSRTYDTSDGYNHKGIDIFTWPFSWYQFQNNQAWVVAAAPGIIIAKADGNFDMNCNFNNNQWNAIYVQHNDGSVAWYGHLKRNTLTSKIVGNTVLAGEYLGVVGSSGNSTGPHLHFEVYNSANQLVDPYQGTCNSWTSSSDSWWQNQKPYVDPKINAVATHSQVFNFNTCPQTESVYLNDNFSSGVPVTLAIYLADQIANTSGVLQLVRPDNTTAASFNVNFTQFYYSSYWYWTYNSSFFNQSGQWKLRFTYLGNTVEHLFNYGTLSAENFEGSSFGFYPNPSEDFITIENKNNVILNEITIVDLSGKILFSEKINFETLNVSNLATGIYFVNFKTETGIYSKKLIKK